MNASASGGLDIGGCGSDKGSIVFTIVELLLIALLLLCNCLNLVSVLGFGAPQAKSAVATSGEEIDLDLSLIDDFEAWQRALVGRADEEKGKWEQSELMAAEGRLVQEMSSSWLDASGD